MMSKGDTTLAEEIGRTIKARPVLWVTVPRFCELTGYTVAGVDKKRQQGVWLEDREWRHAPDGRVLINIEAYESWVEGAASVPQATRSKSILRTRVPGAGSG